MKEGWKYTTIGESCNINYGTRVVRSKDGGTIYDVYGGGGATFKMDTYNREDCLVVARFAMSKQCTRYVKGKFFLNDSGLTVSPKDGSNLSQTLLDKILLALNDTIYSFGRGSAQRNLNIKEFSTMKIAYPINLAEQEKFVSLLDAEFAKIDAIKANAEKQLKDAKDLFQSKIEDSFSDTSNWDCYNISECFSTINNGANIKQTKGASGLPITRIETLSNGIFNANRLGYADIFDSVKYQKYILNEGDILMSHINSLEFVGRSVVFHNQLPIVIHGMNLLRLVPLSFIDSDFFVYLSKTRKFKNAISGITHKSVNQASFNTTALKAIRITVPSIKIQKKIVDDLDKMQSICFSLQQNFDTTVTLCNDLKQSILKDIFG